MEFSTDTINFFAAFGAFSVFVLCTTATWRFVCKLARIKRAFKTMPAGARIKGLEDLPWYVWQSVPSGFEIWLLEIQIEQRKARAAKTK